MMTEDEARHDAWLHELYLEHGEQALAEFTEQRLQSYYVGHPLIAKPSFDALAEARALLSHEHPGAALIYAAIAFETGLKQVLLKPVVFGLVHSEAVAGMIAELVAKNQGFDRFRELLFHILLQYGEIDLKTFMRPSASKPLWQEINDIQQEVRNPILHRAEKTTEYRAIKAISCASSVLETLFPSIVLNLGLHLHNNVRICGDQNCLMDPDLVIFTPN